MAKDTKISITVHIHVVCRSHHGTDVSTKETDKRKNFWCGSLTTVLDKDTLQNVWKVVVARQVASDPAVNT